MCVAFTIKWIPHDDSEVESYTWHLVLEVGATPGILISLVWGAAWTLQFLTTSQVIQV